MLTYTYVHITHERSVLLTGFRVTDNAVNFGNEHERPWQRPSEGLPVLSAAARPKGPHTPGELLR
ncbi:predicted protein [Streptomyces viridosporus ATCC 14672]|uniref:Predicted protein n=1 Tax=Streptomyces viridosporus (strain ATCC 14672 / DSM 40746 / JCM 4963 / KCTC 9882 / NRRL B-12104 / FH 1290) TaxID=566461 RepID=D5ZXJ8_STRV1|nr:predicted protein [Streptomyces viridosporus ATCC 14672]